MRNCAAVSGYRERDDSDARSGIKHSRWCKQGRGRGQCTRAEIPGISGSCGAEIREIYRQRLTARVRGKREVGQWQRIDGDRNRKTVTTAKTVGHDEFEVADDRGWTGVDVGMCSATSNRDVSMLP